MRKIYSFLLLMMMFTLPASIVNAAETKSTKQHEGIEVTVNINTADAKEIATLLQGVGEKKAQDIVDYRNQHGKFKDVDALKQVKGIGQATIDKNKNRILL